MLTKSKHKDRKSLILPVKHNGDLDFKTGAMLLILHGENNWNNKSKLLNINLCNYF